MNPVDNCNVIRPLLSINRFETGKLCSFWQLPIYPDISNQKIKFLRNRVRKQLLPLVKFFFNLKVENVLLQLAEIVEAEDHQMNQVAKDFFIAFHNIGCYNFTNVSAIHHNSYVWVSSINFIKQTSFTTYLPSLGCSLIRLDQLLVPQTLAASQALLRLTILLRTDGNDGTQSNAVLVHTLPHFLKHPASQATPRPCFTLPPYHLTTLPPKVVCGMWYVVCDARRGGAPKVIPSSCITFGEAPVRSIRSNTFDGNSITSFKNNAEGSANRSPNYFSRSKLCSISIYWTTVQQVLFLVATFGIQRQHTLCIRYAHVAPPSLMVRSTCSKLVIRWILTIFALLNTKGVKQKNMGCKAIPVSLSNFFAQSLYPTSDEGMPFSKVCMSKLCRNYVFGNRGSENMWYRYTKGGNYNKLQRLLLTKLMKQNFEFRKLALFSKMGIARNVLPKKGSSNNKKKNSNNFIRKPVEKYVENVLIYNFFLYFEMLKPEKKEIYWPIIISFLPTAFQRRVTKLFLINQDWKKIRYSQVFNFLAKKKKLC